MKPSSFNNNIGYPSILGFGTRMRDNMILFGRRGVKITTEINTKPRRGSTCGRTVGPINIRVRNQTIDIGYSNRKVLFHHTFKATKNALKRKEILNTRIMHEMTNLLNYISSIRMNESLILEGPN